MAAPSARDWKKVKAFLDGTWPEPIPRGVVIGDRSDPRVAEWLQDAFEAPYLVIDTEYDPTDRRLTLVGVGYPWPDGLRVVQCPWNMGWTPARAVFERWLRVIVAKVPVVFQNAIADIPVLAKHLGIEYHHYRQVEDTMLAHAVLWSEWPHELEFLASIYGVHPKLKHLSDTDPLLYNLGDVIDTIASWEGLRAELRADPASERIYREQSLRLVPILLRRMERGIRVNQKRVESAAVELAEKKRGAALLAHAYTGLPLGFDPGGNPEGSLLASPAQLAKWLYEVEGLPAQRNKDTKRPTVDDDAVAALREHVGPPPDTDRESKQGLALDEALARVEEGANPILEARVIYAAAQQDYSHYVEPAWGRERVYPQYKVHAQASGRWSITGPPLQQLPKDLVDILLPDLGEVWIGWDWDQIELRLLAALSGDKPLLEAFEHGWDIHTLNTCDLFGWHYPPNRVDPHHSIDAAGWREAHRWEGKEDKRRRFAKVFVYRLNYGGDPKSNIPGAKQLGLGKLELVQAGNRYLAAHPALAAWRRRVAAEALRTRESRTFMGRRRRLLGEGQGVIREAYNHPMQGGVSDILNTTIIAIAEALPCSSMVYTTHDAAKVAVPESKLDEALPIIKAIVDREWDVYGVRVRFPATFNVRRAT